jgi:luciferase family oxidoreductase group 1
MTAYSVLDQAPIRAGGAAGHPFHEMVALARHVDGLGFARFWIAEHHALGSAGCAAPEILIGPVAAATTRLRVGSGGILLPNHRPLHVAEQFRTLEALHPGRIDLGIGRSEGATDDAVVLALGRPGDTGHGAGFDAQLDQLLAFGGARELPSGDPLASVRAVPQDVPLPPVFLLGSSASSAVTAARRGLGYGFAAHTNPDGAAPALRAYREQFVPAHPGDRPHAILALKVMVGEDDAQAEALAAPWNLAMIRHRAGAPGPMGTVEEALAHRLTAAEVAAQDKVDLRADVVGGPERVGALLARSVAAAQADEVIAITNTFSPDERRASYTRLAELVGLG